MGRRDVAAQETVQSQYRSQYRSPTGRLGHGPTGCHLTVQCRETKRGRVDSWCVTWHRREVVTAASGEIVDWYETPFWDRHPSRALREAWRWCDDPSRTPVYVLPSLDLRG